MNSLIDLLLEVLEESGTLCGIDTSQDRKTILARYETEGESFLTITLPSIVKDLYKALDQEKVTPDLFVAFKRLKGRVLPVFLGGFFEQLFDTESGVLTHVASSDDLAATKVAQIVRAIVQISGLCGKLFEVCSDKRNEAAMKRYIENDSMVRLHDGLRETKLAEQGLHKNDLRLIMHLLFGRVLTEANEAIRRDELKPHHGPGSTADRLLGNQKWQQPQWPERLETVFPYGRWAYNSWLNYLDDVQFGRIEDPGPEIPCKVISVPKTQKTPRIIAIEPTHMQYMQQGVRGVLEKAIANDSYATAVMGYSDQTLNQRMAREGSITGLLATLDLSDASDLVSYELVDYLFKDWPALRVALWATRSQQARVLDQVIDLAKFASMGSALCFPIEAMVFSVIVFAGIYAGLGRNTELRTLKRELEGRVRVYGDDIIVPVEHAQSVVDCLEACGLKVNRAKSFWSGYFRESCGKEYWRGHDVTYVKLRHRLPTLRKPLSEDSEAVVHTVAFANNLREGKCYTNTVALLDELLDKRLKGLYPVVLPTSSALGRHSLFGSFTIEKIDRDLQRPLVKAYVVNTTPPASVLDGYAALMKCLCTDSDLPNPDTEHLARAGRWPSLRLKKAWTSPF